MFTEYRVKGFDYGRFQNGEMKKRATSTKNRKFVVVMKSTLSIVEQMLADDGRFMELLWTTVGLARAGTAFTV